MNTLISHLEINNLRIKVKIGNSKEERLKPQDVEISLKIYFNILPNACKTDLIDDTICYDKICREITLLSESREFKLIEYFTYQIYQLLKQHISNDISLYVKKIMPPISNLLGGTSFAISDLKK